MKIIISWSGELSYTIAVLFSKWLPLVIQPVTTIVSAGEDKKGDAWFKKLMYQVRQTDFAIICLIRSNNLHLFMEFTIILLFVKFPLLIVVFILYPFKANFPAIKWSY